MNAQQEQRLVSHAAAVATFAFCAWQLTKGNGAPLARLSSPTTQLAMQVVAVCIASSIAVAVGVTRTEFPAPPCSYEPSGPQHPPSDELETALVQTGAFDRREWQVLLEDPLRRYHYIKSVYSDAAPATTVLALLTAKITRDALIARIRLVVALQAAALVFDAPECVEPSAATAAAAVEEANADALLEASLEEYEFTLADSFRTTPDSVLDGSSLPVTPEVHHGRSCVVGRTESFVRGRSPTWISNASFDTATTSSQMAARKASLQLPMRPVVGVVTAAEADDVLVLPSLRHDASMTTKDRSMSLMSDSGIKDLVLPPPVAPYTKSAATHAGANTTTTTMRHCRTRAAYAADPNIKIAYRHDPYTHRAFKRLDQGPSTCRTTVTLPFVQDEQAAPMDIPSDLLFKPNTASLSIRPRLSGGVVAGSVKGAKTNGSSDRADTGSRCSTLVSLKSPKVGGATPKTPSAGMPTPIGRGRSLSQAILSPISLPPSQTLPPQELPGPTDEERERSKAKQAKISAARKAMKKAYDASGMTLSQPLFGLRVDVDDSDVPVLEEAEAPMRLSAPMLFEHGQVTMTGLPNIDGHRVALELLDRLANLGVIRGAYNLATAERRTDRFNTGACHITLDCVDDARRLYGALNRMTLFADLRGTDIVVTRAQS